MPAANIGDAEEREVEAREFAGEELRRESGAKEGAAPPRGGESGGVVGVEVGQEVGLATGAPPINRYHSTLH